MISSQKLQSPEYYEHIINLQKSLLEKESECLHRLKMELSFHEFVKGAWHVIEGNRQFIDGWHIQGLCEHLEALHRLEIRKLLVNLSPRSCKSTIIAVMFQPWTWIHQPELQYLCVSLNDDLSRAHAIKSRNLISSDWYQQRWGHIVSIDQTQNNQSKYANSSTGFRESCSILAKLTGKGGNRIIIDDPNSAQESGSERQRVIEKYTGELSTRTNNPADECWILDQQRTNVNDLTGFLLKFGDDWVKYIIPMEHEVNRICRTVVLPSTNGKVWEDPRKDAGELMWPEHLNRKKVDSWKKVMRSQGGDYLVAGQLQQRPSPEEGGIFKKSHFKIWKNCSVPRIDFIIQSWDTAMEAHEKNALSVCTTWGLFEDYYGIPNIMLLQCWSERVEYPELRKLAKRFYKDYRDNGRDDYKSNSKPVKPDIILVEAKATGIPLVQDLKRAQIPATPFNPNLYGDKIQRARLISHLIEDGRVWLPAKPPHYDNLRGFAEEFLDACAVFPSEEGRDHVDTMSQALITLKKKGLLYNSKDDEDLDSEDIELKNTFSEFE